MSPTRTPAEVFERELLPVLDTGYRLALLCTGGTERAMQAVEDSAVTASRRPAGPHGAAELFLRLVLGSCALTFRPAWEEPLPTLGEVDLPLLTELLGELPVAVRAAVALSLANDFRPAQVARILDCSVAELQGLQLLAWDAIGARLARTLRPTPSRPARRLSIPA